VQIINKEVGNSIHHDYKIYEKNGNEIISNSQNVTDRLNYFLLKL